MTVHRATRATTEMELHLLAAACEPGDTFVFPKRVFDMQWTLWFPSVPVDAEPITVEGNHAKLRFLSNGDDVPVDPRAKNKRYFLQARPNLFLGYGVDVHQLRCEGVNEIKYVTAYEFQHGVQGVGRNTVEEVITEGVFGDFFRLNGDHPVLRDSRGYGCGRQGISHTAGNDMFVERVTLGGIARTAIDLEAQAKLNGVVRGFTARDLKIGTYGNRILAAASDGGVHDVTIDDLDTDGVLSVQIENGDKSNFTLRRWHGKQSKNRPAAVFRDVYGHVLIDDWDQPFHGKPAPAAVETYDCEDPAVTRSRFPGATTDLLRR